MQVVVAVTNDSAPGGGEMIDSQRVDAAGVAAVADAAAAALQPRAAAPVPETVVQASKMAAWAALNDTIMGGASSSEIAAVEGVDDGARRSRPTQAAGASRS